MPPASCKTCRFCNWLNYKAALNAKKHGVTFEEAVEVFQDPHRVIEKNESGDHGEARWTATGATRNGNKTLVVAFTRRTRSGKETIRIISAWSIGNRGRRRYGYRDTKAE